MDKIELATAPSKMQLRAPNCSICLRIGADIRKISEADDNNRSPMDKLKSCVSEIAWNENYLICASCVHDLNLVHEFREKCFNSEHVRNQLVVSTEPEFDTIEISDKPYQCQVCSKKFRTSSYLKQHCQYHRTERSYICTYCGKSYLTKNDLKIHEKTHLNKREYKCADCPKSFNTHKDLRAHKLVVHTDRSFWQHVCQQCGKRFPIKSNYDAHMRRHNDERPFACHLCDKKFIDKSVLQKHIRSHSNIRAFVCEICSKEYKDKHVMDIHRAKIHGVEGIKIPVRERKYFCHVCPKSYIERSKLNRHLCSHTGERPYCCQMCQKRFSDKSYIRQHMKKIHKVDFDN